MISILAKTNPLIAASSNYAQSIEDIITNTVVQEHSSEEMNPGFLMMYEQWKQEILLSDGMTEDYKSEW